MLPHRIPPYAEPSVLNSTDSSCAVALAISSPEQSALLFNINTTQNAVSKSGSLTDTSCIGKTQEPQPKEDLV